MQRVKYRKEDKGDTEEKRKGGKGGKGEGGKEVRRQENNFREVSKNIQIGCQLGDDGKWVDSLSAPNLGLP